MKNKGVILAGGSGTRLYPLTKVTNKCLLPMGNKPMINYLIDLLKLADINDIMLITNPEHVGDVVRLLGSGSEFGCNITYKIQDQSNGIAAALSLCEEFCAKSKFAVILGDNIFQDLNEISKSIKNFFKNDDDYHLFLKEVTNPQRFGVPIFENNKIIDIIEKPVTPPNNMAITGLYLYTDQVFEIIKTLKPSQRGEYEISDVNSYLVKNKKGSWTSITKQWIDAGTFESYLKANIMVSE